ncbi:MAG: hypothetical protein H0X63_13075 [Flavobacteriales bacterium]|nr:hypothetical protein [Flavobacteriales bacterium]
MKLYFQIFFLLLFISVVSCSDKKESCEEFSKPYWSTTLFGKSHNTNISGEKITIRNSYKDIVAEEIAIIPKDGFINLKIYLDKFGNFCSTESYEIDQNYEATSFNNGELRKKLEYIASTLKGWTVDTETKTFYLIKFVIKDGVIKEIF